MALSKMRGPTAHVRDTTLVVLLAVDVGVASAAPFEERVAPRRAVGRDGCALRSSSPSTMGQESLPKSRRTNRPRSSGVGITFSSVIEAPQAETFAWHERPGAIERLTPPFQPVRVVSEAEQLSDGRAVLRLPGGLRWVAVHEGYEAPLRFTDRLVSLPLHWRHTHLFEARSKSSTLVTDEVETPLPERLLRPMFVYRHRQLAEDLTSHHALRQFAPTHALYWRDRRVGSRRSVPMPAALHGRPPRNPLGASRAGQS